MALSLRRLLNPADPLLNLRLASAASLGIGVLALFSVNPDPVYLLALVICWVGCWFSHRMRGRSSRIVKSLLAVGMLYLLWQYLANLIANLQDTRLPLAELLLWLQVLNAFDLPRRHNLRIAQMVGAILLISTATLSREMTFGLFVLAYAVMGLWWGHEDMVSELGAKVSILRPESRRHFMRALAVMLVLGGGLFLFVPRLEGGFLKQLPVSMMMTLPANLSPKIINSAYPAGQVGSGSGRRVNPEAYYGFAEELDLNFRGRLSDEVALKVRSPRRQYWRGMAYDRYDGRSWRLFSPNEIATMSIGTLPFILGNDPLDSGVTGVVTVYVEKDQTNLVLLPERPRRLYFPSSVLFADVNMGLRSPVTLDEGLYYTVVMDMAGYRRSGLARAPRLSLAWRRQLAPYLQTPASLTPRTRALARQVVGDATSSFEAVRRLETHLKEHYRYDLDVPPFPEGVDTVDYFLFDQPDKSAYCEQFATALAVMARSVGVPTRLVTGYLPGTYNPFTGLYEVKTSEAHAWVEAFFPGTGWVPFDPTPGSSDPMGISQEASRLPIRELLGRVQGGLGLLLAIAVASSVLLGGAWLFGRLRFGRRARELAPTLAYRRYLALLSRHGLDQPQAGDTPGMHLERLRAEPGFEAIATEAERFVRSYEAERFGGVPADEPLVSQVAAIAERLKARKNG